MSSHLTHIDEKGKARMVDVDSKNSSKRFASAKATVYVGPEILNLIRSNEIKKGDVLSVAQLAGIISAKRTAEFIPLCHNIPLSSVDVCAEIDATTSEILIVSKVKCEGKTGVEMEALVAASIAALTVYDMCKAVSHDIIIKEIKLMEKSGGKNDFRRETNVDGAQELVLNFNTEPIQNSETFYPIHI